MRVFAAVLRRKGDDRVFRLVRTELAQCEDLAFNSQKPLRHHEP